MFYQSLGVNSLFVNMTWEFNPISFYCEIKVILIIIIMLTQKSCLTYSSTDNYLSPIPVSDWLIFYCGNSIIHQKKKWKWQKQIFDDKQQKNAMKVYVI